jgi:uncharacterized protein YjbI with pentapeptide repeats
MTQNEYIEILKKGVNVWNKWRLNNIGFCPTFHQIQLENYNFASYNFEGTSFYGCKLKGCNFDNANFSKALISSDCSNSSFRGVNMKSANIVGGNISFSNFSGSNLKNIVIEESNANNSKFVNVDLRRAVLWSSFINADFTGSCLIGTSLKWTNLTNAILINVDLRETQLVDTILIDATLQDCNIHGISTWNLKTDGCLQLNLVISKPSDNALITVDNIEIAQFINLLLDNKKIRDVIDTVSSKAVLILGRFTTERKDILDSIKNQLREYGYLPILFDFEKPKNRDTQETITTLARLSKFIIADITDPKSIPQELTAISAELTSVPIKPIILKGNEPWGMFDAIRRKANVLDVFEYDGKIDLIQSLKLNVIDPVEEKLIKLRKNY